MRLPANMKVKTKLVGGFVLAAAITGMVGTTGYWGMSRCVGNAHAA